MFVKRERLPMKTSNGTKLGLERRAVLAVSIGLGAIALTAEARPPWPIVKEYGGASPKNENTWITPDDYPNTALQRKTQGNVIVAFTITAKGRAVECAVEQSSGQLALDVIPCPLIERRARFQPAKNANGAPISTEGRYSVAFWIPD